MRKLGTIWLDFCPGFEKLNDKYLVKRTEGTMVHDPDEIITRSDVSSLIQRGYRVFIDKRK